MDNLNFPQEFLDNLYNFPFCEINSLKSEEGKSDDVIDNSHGDSVPSYGDSLSDTAVKQCTDSNTETNIGEESTKTECQDKDNTDPVARKRKSEVNKGLIFVAYWVSDSCTHESQLVGHSGSLEEINLIIFQAILTYKIKFCL